jgi:hypothetical protein
MEVMLSRLVFEMRTFLESMEDRIKWRYYRGAARLIIEGQVVDSSAGISVQYWLLSGDFLKGIVLRAFGTDRWW